MHFGRLRKAFSALQTARDDQGVIFVLQIVDSIRPPVMGVSIHTGPAFRGWRVVSGKILTPLEHTTSAGLVPNPYGDPPLWTFADVHSTPARTSVS